MNQIITQAQNRIEIVIGGGINLTNIKSIIKNISNRSNKISIHAFSGVFVNGITSVEAVKNLISAIRNSTLT